MQLQDIKNRTRDKESDRFSSLFHITLLQVFILWGFWSKHKEETEARLIIIKGCVCFLVLLMVFPSFFFRVFLSFIAVFYFAVEISSYTMEENALYFFYHTVNIWSFSNIVVMGFVTTFVLWVRSYWSKKRVYIHMTSNGLKICKHENDSKIQIKCQRYCPF